MEASVSHPATVHASMVGVDLNVEKVLLYNYEVDAEYHRLYLNSKH